ncbi:hypothetical protein Tco_0059078 [Tanacetum coccineum]
MGCMIRAKLEVNIARLKKLVLLAEVSTASRKVALGKSLPRVRRFEGVTDWYQSQGYREPSQKFCLDYNHFQTLFSQMGLEGQHHDLVTSSTDMLTMACIVLALVGYFAFAHHVFCIITVTYTSVNTDSQPVTPSGDPMMRITKGGISRDDGDDDDGDSSGDDAKEDEDDEDEDDEDEEEEEHLAPADSTIVVPVDEPVFSPEGTEPVIPPPSTDITIGARITVRPQTSISLPLEVEVERLLAMTTPSPSPPISLSPPSAREHLARMTSTQPLIDAVTAALPSPPPPPLPPSLYIPPLVDHRDEIPESMLPTTQDPQRQVPEIAPRPVERVNTRVTELDELHEHDTQDLYAY